MTQHPKPRYPKRRPPFAIPSPSKHPRLRRIEAFAKWPKITASNPTTGTKENKPRMRLAVASPLLRKGPSGSAAGPIGALSFCADLIEAGLSGESDRPQKRQKASVSATSLPQLGQNMSHLPSPPPREADGRSKAYSLKSLVGIPLC